MSEAEINAAIVFEPEDKDDPESECALLERIIKRMTRIIRAVAYLKT